MKFFLHTLNSWFLAVMITDAIIISTWFLDEFCGYPTGVTDVLLAFFFIFIFGLFLSLPALLMAFFFLSFIGNLNTSSIEKAFFWFLSVFISILFSIFGYGFFIENKLISSEELFEMWPIFLGTILALSFRYKQFFNLIYKKQDDGNF